jgi:hypothetical protein
MPSFSVVSRRHLYQAMTIQGRVGKIERLRLFLEMGTEGFFLRDIQLSQDSKKF